MPNPQSLYPNSPANVPAFVTEVSPSFKKEVKKVLIAIALFFTVYLVLIALSLALAAGCIYAGLYIIVGSGHIIGILAGLGIISMGLLVFFFLIKFIFSVKKFDESDSIPVSETDQPELFSFIRQLTTDTQTRFPGKIIISPEVNACVFYNDSFWSMLFPVKKNLKIGLGLVNSLTLSEFKAVMAHEFGHFSQRSMKLGSFVYNVNKALFNMLYENKDFSRLLEKWGSVHIAVGIFVWITAQIVNGIQKILQLMYGFINKSYMALSREMEFHADAVAASVSGSGNCITALRKIEVSDVCYQAVIQKANEFLAEDAHLENVYQNHDEVMIQYARYNHLPLENNTPVADDAFFKKFQLNKVNIKDQWASHPPREDREAHLLQLDTKADKDTRPAMLLFNRQNGFQQEITSLLYKAIPNEKKKTPIDAAAFSKRYRNEVIAYTLPEEYNGFYDNRQMPVMDVDAIAQRPFNTTINSSSFASLYTNEWVALAKDIAADETDEQLLKAISEKRIDVKTFDYDGEKMNRDAAPALLEKLTAITAQQKAQLQEYEETAFAFFYNAALQYSGEEAKALVKKYAAHFENREKAESLAGIIHRIMELLAPLLGGQTVSVETASAIAGNLCNEGDRLRPYLESCVKSGIYADNAELAKKVDSFITTEYRYFHNGSFFGDELGALHFIVNETYPLLGNYQFKSFKRILEFQLELYKKATATSNLTEAR
jgi:Zn-dependent protease with chaperone function